MKRRSPRVSLTSSAAYFLRVRDTGTRCAGDWACPHAEIRILFGNSDSSTGRHPNFQIERVVAGTTVRRAAFWGVNGNPNLSVPGGYNPKELSGPHTIPEVDQMATAAATEVA